MAAEAEIGEGEATEEAGAKKKGRISKKLLIIIIAAVVVILGGGAGAYFFLFSGAPAATEGEHAEGPEVHPTFIFNLPTMTVNLQDEGQGQQYMKLTIALEVADEHVMEEIQPRMARVVDAFQVYLRELRKSDLEGSAGVYRIKEELRRRINVAIYPQEIIAILFKEILVQ